MLEFDTVLFEASAKKAARLLRALANERRLMVLCQLTNGELSVGEIQSRVGLSQSALSQHLRVLRDEQIVASRREAQTVRYRISDPDTVRVVGTLAEVFRPGRVEATP